MRSKHAFVHTLSAGLELEHLVLAVSQLRKDPGQLTLVRGADLGSADGLVHAGRSTDKDLDVLLLGLGEDGLQELLGDVALAAGPLLGRVVQQVEGPEAAGVGVLQLLQLLLQENVLLTDVAEDKGDLGLVLGVLEDLASQLVHGGDTSTTGDQADMLVLVGLPGVFGDRSFELQALVDVHAVQVLGHGAVGVDLDYEVEVAGLLCGNGVNLLRVYTGTGARTFIAHGCVGTDDRLLGALGLELGQQGS